MKATSRIGIYLALAAACGLDGETFAATTGKVPLPRPRPHINTAKQVGTVKQAAAPAFVTPLPPQFAPLPQKRPLVGSPALAYAQANVATQGALFERRAAIKPLARPVSGPFAIAQSAATPEADIAAVKRVIEAARKGKEAEANAAEASISDPVARKLAEWVILRSDNTNPTFQRYAAFVEANPSWPHSPLFRRRAENALWNDG
ncbi:MAG TPA: lytic transglycosylase domain-containing protein, partial [Pseudolabrys sp.]|nr:lytic transglycosylase domain-containing protein [Pseudolabrys sp.]